MSGGGDHVLISLRSPLGIVLLANPLDEKGCRSMWSRQVRHCGGEFYAMALEPSDTTIAAAVQLFGQQRRRAIMMAAEAAVAVQEAVAMVADTKHLN